MPSHDCLSGTVSFLKHPRKGQDLLRLPKQMHNRHWLGNVIAITQNFHVYENVVKNLMYTNAQFHLETVSLLLLLCFLE